MELSEYTVVINGYEATLQLTEEDARKRGLTKSNMVKPASAASKSRTTANKSRTAQNKGD